MKAAKRASIRASIASVLGRAGPRPERKRGRDWDARGEAAGRVGPPPASGGAHSRQSLRRPWRGSLATRVQPRLRCKTWVMAATVLAIRTARPAVSAMSSQSFETSTPMHKGPARAERSVEADRRRATMTHLSQEGEGPLAQDCNSGWARPAVRAQDRKGRTTDRDCLRPRVPSRIDLAVLPAILTADAEPPKNSRSTRTIQESSAPYDPWIAASLRSSR